MRALLLALCLSVNGLWACASSSLPQPGDVITVQGRVVLKGNEPFIIAVLKASGQQWDLRGMSREQMLELQSRTVAVTGKVVRLPSEGMPAQLEVQSVR